MPFFAGLAVIAVSSVVPTASAESWPPGAIIEQAAFADIMPEGFDAIADLIPALLPENIPMSDMGDSSEGTWGQCWLGGYEYSIEGMWVGLEVVDARIVPGNGVLDVTIDLMVWVNDTSDPFDLYAELECLGDTCSSYVDPFLVTVTTTMALDVITGDAGEPVLDATIGTLNVSYDLTGEDIHLDDCVIGTIEEVLNFFGISLYDLLLSLVDSYLQDAIADFGPDLEATIEEAFGSATIEQDLDVNGAVIHMELFPSDVEITPAGVRLQMSGAMDGSVASCVAAYDPGGSLRTDSVPPRLGDVPNGVDSPYHLAMTLSDDFANEAMYALWRGGLLCYSIEPGGDIPLDTSILNLLSGDAFVEFFPESKPLTLRTAPAAPPVVNYAGSHDVGLVLTDLGLEFYAELDGRSARMLSIALTGEVGADIEFDGTTGALAVAVALAADDLVPSIAYNEFVPEADESILSSFGGAFGGLLDTVVGGLLDSLAFALPSMEGIGLQDLQAAPSGPDSDWLGLYTWIGVVTYESADGCGGCGGSDGGEASSCGGGCTVAGTNIPHPAFWMLGTLLLLRRRRD